MMMKDKQTAVDDATILLLLLQMLLDRLASSVSAGALHISPIYVNPLTAGSIIIISRVFAFSLIAVMRLTIYCIQVRWA